VPIAAATPDAIAEAAALLRAGRLVAFPTETVYGLGGDATDDRAVAAIYAAKGRPSFNPLIVHLPDAARIDALVATDSRTRALAARFWPGPLTLVLPRRADAGVSLLASAGLPSLAVRMPDHPVAQALLRAVDRPLAAPSANPSGRISPTTAQHVADGLHDAVAMILDGGPCAVGLESTVLDLTARDAVLLRPGGIARETLEAAIGPVRLPETASDAAPHSPGRLPAHYAPERPLRMNATEAAAGEALLGFGGTPGAVLDLSPAGDAVEAAAHLFAMLRALDRAPYTGIAVAPVPEAGLGVAINDRLRRAAHR
jgi:L-threonylcarbamoyladenylate synthase